MVYVVIILSLLLLLLLLYKTSLRPTNFPPGPNGYPLIGSVPLFLTAKEHGHLALQKLAKVYGPVTGFYLGPSLPYISVVGSKAVKEALTNDDLNGRPTSNLITSRTFGERLGVILVDGQFWQDHRRFTLRHLRDLGFGKTSIEGQMLDEVSNLIDDIKEAADSDPSNIVNFNGIFTASVVNILWAIVAGERFPRNDARLKELLASFEKFFRQGSNITAVFPVPQFVIDWFPSVMKILRFDIQELEPIKKFIQQCIDNHESTLNLDEPPRDFIDVFLSEMKHSNKNGTLTTFSKNQLVAIILDLFAAGSDTTTHSIGFAILRLIHHPEVQKKLQDEIDSVCSGKFASLTDRPNLPYVEAFLMEVQRISSIAPLGVPHTALKDTKLLTYTIPKGSIVTLNLHSVLNDNSVWGDPENFRPERFLDDSGKLVKNEHFIPFGHGKRMCLGESLARNSFYLFVTGLVKAFHFEALPDCPLPTLEPIDGFTLSPRPFQAVVKTRSS